MEELLLLLALLLTISILRMDDPFPGCRAACVSLHKAGAFCRIHNAKGTTP
jgi:hypothetical protein